jgi:drug/metabolite transporter (DMT)-like permease
MKLPDRPRIARAETLLFVCTVLWAANYPVTKYGIAALHLFVFNALRYVVAAVVLLAVFAFSRERWVSVAPDDWKRLLGAGFIANVLYQVAFIVGLNLTTAGNASVLLATAPLWTIVINARMHGEKIPRTTWGGILVSLTGVVLIVAGSGKKFHLGGNEIVGDLLCLAAAFFWATNTNLQKPLLGRYAPMQMTLIMVTVGAVGLSLVAAPWVMTMDRQPVDLSHYAAMIWSGLFSIAVGNILWSTGVQHLGPGKTGSYGNLIPVMALAISYVWLGEELTVLQLTGAAVTVLGVWYARR